MGLKKDNMTAKEFLEANGIDLNTTVFSTVIDGYMRQPDLITLLDTYADCKIKELDIKLEMGFAQI
jgi:hypothetical protein